MISYAKYEVRGIITQNLYAEGTEADCHRYLNKKHPSYERFRPKKRNGLKGDVSERKRSPVFKEPLKIERLPERMW